MQCSPDLPLLLWARALPERRTGLPGCPPWEAPHPMAPTATGEAKAPLPPPRPHPMPAGSLGRIENKARSLGSMKRQLGLGLTLVAEPCGREDLCPSGGSLPTGCRQAVNVTYLEKIFPMSYFYANYLNVFGKENTKYPMMREY